MTIEKTEVHIAALASFAAAGTKLDLARQKEREMRASVATLRHDTVTAAPDAPQKEVVERAGRLRDDEVMLEHLTKARSAAEQEHVNARERLRACEIPYFKTQHAALLTRRGEMAHEVDALLDQARQKLVEIDGISPEFHALQAAADASPAAQPGKPLFGNLNGFTGGAHLTALASPVHASALKIMVQNEARQRIGRSVAGMLGHGGDQGRTTLRG